MAEELGKLTEHVGGAEHAHVLLLPLETLCAPEEAMVRSARGGAVSVWRWKGGRREGGRRAFVWGKRVSRYSVR